MSNTSILLTRYKVFGTAGRFNDIHSIEPDGSADTALTSNPAAGGQYYDYVSARYNSDRSKLALLRSKRNPEELPNVFILDVASGALTQITSGELDFASVDWSPDDSQLLVVATDASGNYQVQVMQADGSGLTPLTSGAMEVWDAQYSPDGTQIAFSRLVSPPDRGSLRIWLMNADGSAPRQLPTGNQPAYAPCWSPDGASIAFNYARQRICKMDIASGSVTELTQPPSGFVDDSPVWTAAGICFSRFKELKPEFPVGAIYIMDSNGANAHAITPEADITMDFPTDG